MNPFLKKKKKTKNRGMNSRAMHLLDAKLLTCTDKDLNFGSDAET